jgi:hypothetical protein
MSFPPRLVASRIRTSKEAMIAPFQRERDAALRRAAAALAAM